MPEGETTPNIPYFVLEEDGTVIQDGDSGYNCRSFIVGLEQGGYDSREVQEQAQQVREKCEQLGLSSGGDFEPGNAEIVLELSRSGGDNPENGG